ncbi:MAG: CBS domain-containing protein [Peptococcaceae bacterium]|nr:CBS domain-containing protein [Peptococcaceae bacterium]
MEIITTHTNTDLDALASMVAAQKLYPGAVMVFPGKLSRNVEEFMALHKDTLNVKAVRDIEPELVEMVILVDTRSPGRLAKLAELLEKPGVEVHIYDHHPRGEGDITGRLEVVEMVGATTTLLVEKIRERGIELTPMEATILSLGIYEDTGSLVFSSTTARDAEAVAYLLARGANLAVVSDFLGRPLTEDQRALLKELLVSAERHQINGIDFLIAKGNVDEFVGGLALLTHKLADFAHLDAVFAVVEMEDRVHVVARSSVPEVNVKEILGELGGGGHPAAASATIKKAQVDEVAERLLEAIRARVRPPVTAADIMSSPVKTITPETVIEEAGRIMLRYGHTGLPVVKGDRVVGVISRRDVEKAVHHGLGHAPVKGFMNSNLVTVAPEAPVSAVRELMIEHDIGRLPVLKDGRLVGIVSRTDVLRTLHGEVQSRHQKVYTGHSYEISYRNIQELMYRGLSPEYMNILERAGEIAAGLGYRVYGAGGIVRDLILGMECLDIDLVVEGDGIELARAMGNDFGGRVRMHPKFRTATVLFPGGQQVDVATARVEFYQYPAAMPQVEASSLHQDLYRRDFTINAMAVSLNRDDFGDVVDFFGGREDLERGLIRVLHNLSFVEDPTRLLRGVRFEKRYQMTLEPQTLRLAKEAVRSKMLARVSMERVWEELKHILLEPRPGPVLSRLMELQLWDFLFPGVDHFNIRQVMAEMPRSVKALRSWDLAEPGEPWMVYFLAVLHRADWDSAREICRRYHLGRRQVEKVAAALGGWRSAMQDLKDPDGITMSELARQLMSIPREVYPLILTYLTSNASRKRFRQVLTAIYYDRPSINGKDLREMGYKPGPAFKRALDAVWQARLDGLVRTRQEELNYVREYLAGYEGAVKSV